MLKLIEQVELNDNFLTYWSHSGGLIAVSKINSVIRFLQKGVPGKWKNKKKLHNISNS